MLPVHRRWFRRHPLLTLMLALAAWFAHPAAAQNVDDDVPAYLSIVAGAVALDRDGQIENAVENMPLVAGDRLSTARGRVEIRLGRDAVLSVDESSDVRFLDATLVALDAGALHLNIRGNVAFRVDGAASTMAASSGEFRVRVVDDGRTPELRVTALRGSAEVFSPTGRTIVRAGYEVASPALGDPGRPYVVSLTRIDAFDRWVDANRRDRTGPSASSYLPSDLRDYDMELSRSGDWGYAAPYGYVWYPRVAVGWRPYSDGQWTFVGSFGWTWAAGPRWGWPTHHYGRWGWRGARWYWIPGARWAPAWVSWGSVPGYVGWCPLGFDNRPVIAMTSGAVWNGWTTVPIRAFSRSVIVGRHAVRPVEGHWPRTAAVENGGPARPIGARTTARALAAPRRPGPTRTAVAAPTRRVASAPAGRAGSASATRAVSAAPAARFGLATRPAIPRRTTRPEARPVVAVAEQSLASRATTPLSPSQRVATPRGVSRTGARSAAPSAPPARASRASTERSPSQPRRSAPTTASANQRAGARIPTSRASQSVPARSRSMTGAPPSPTQTPAPSSMRRAAPR